MRMKMTLLFVLCITILVLTSCSFPGTNPPVTKPTQTPSTSASYTFVRQGQLWVSLNGKPPAQATNFDYSNLGVNPNIFWRQPIWSPGDSFIAFILKAIPTGIGGGGVCPPGLNYANSGALYILNTQTQQLTRVAFPVTGTPVDTNPLNGYWQHIFWEDATHLLVYGSLPQNRNSGGLYRYDLTEKILKVVIPESSLNPSGAGTLYPGELWFPLRYSSGLLYYQVIEADPQNSKHIKFVIYSHSTLHPELSNIKVLDAGSEPVPEARPNTIACPSYTNPGWDISPDGKQLVAQMLLTDSTGKVSSSIRAMHVIDNSMVTMFGQLSSQVLSGDVTLTWAPDNQTVLLSSWSSQIGPYSSTLQQPAQTQAYPPDTTGHVVWRPDSLAFALFQFQQYTLVSSNTAQVFLFVPGKSGRQLLLTNAQNFAWGSAMI